jgi:hypothetical protein
MQVRLHSFSWQRRHFAVLRAPKQSVGLAPKAKVKLEVVSFKERAARLVVGVDEGEDPRHASAPRLLDVGADWRAELREAGV